MTDLKDLLARPMDAPVTSLATPEVDAISIAQLVDRDPALLTPEERLLIIRKIRANRQAFQAADLEAKKTGTKIKASAPKAPKTPKLKGDEAAAAAQAVSLDEIEL